MKELVVISGKGGTGKTSIVASLAQLAQEKVMVDCDVDASDLHLILRPEITQKTEFVGGRQPFIDRDKCTSCSECLELCRFDAISDDFEINRIACEGCGVCAYFCPEKAIQMRDKISGEWYISDTRYGPMVHAMLGIAEANSGKMVSHIRKESKKIAKENNYELIICDGSPGIGCPVIASITGANILLIVVEPSVSGIHDMKRVHELAQHFNIKSMLCINKFDLSNEITKEIESYCSEKGIEIVAKIPYDIDFTKAQLKEKSIVEYSHGKASQEVRMMWGKIINHLQ